MSTPFNPDIHLSRDESEVSQIQTIMQRLQQKMRHDHTVQQTTDELRAFLQVNRVVLYYFYREWEGRVTFESLSDQRFSILGSTGPDQCFNEEYAALYLEGRVRAIADIETAEIAPCHRDFLRYLSVQANLVVPILIEKDLPKKELWGLLVAHHCQAARAWLPADIEKMKAGALELATAPSVVGP